MKCVICDSEIQEQKWAIRDYNNESYVQWLMRHIKKVFTCGWYKSVPFHLPVCDRCVSSYAKKLSSCGKMDKTYK